MKAKPCPKCGATMRYERGEADCSDYPFDYPEWLECPQCGTQTDINGAALQGGEDG